jgi:hypothetical protein
MAAKTAQTEEFMFQNVAYRPTDFKTGVWGRKVSSAIVLSGRFLPLECKPVNC